MNGTSNDRQRSQQSSIINKQQEAPRSIMGRRATDVNHLAISVAKVLQKETGTLGQVPTVGCQLGGLRMHVSFK